MRLARFVWFVIQHKLLLKQNRVNHHPFYLIGYSISFEKINKKWNGRLRTSLRAAAFKEALSTYFTAFPLRKQSFDLKILDLDRYRSFLFTWWLSAVEDSWSALWSFCFRFLLSLSAILLRTWEHAQHISWSDLPPGFVHMHEHCYLVTREGVRLCRPIALSPQVMSPQPKLRRPNIGVVSPQHQSCVAPTRNFAYQVKVCKILRSIYANDRLIT